MTSNAMRSLLRPAFSNWILATGMGPSRPRVGCIPRGAGQRSTANLFATPIRDGSTLEKWHDAVAQVDPSNIIPKGFGAATDVANIAAFFGDQRINLAVSLALKRTTGSGGDSADDDPKATGGLPWLTETKAEAVSNSLFAYHIQDILPEQGREFAEVAQTQPHCAGTMVEAAVEAVATSIQSPDSREAIDELAEWLVARALERESTNYKGRLLNIGGTINVERVDEDGLDHEPVFLATACLDGKCFEAEGRSKLKAEQAASALLLQFLFGKSGHGIETNTKSRVKFDSDEEVLEQKFVEINADLAMNLKNGEDGEGWWIRKSTTRRSAFHAAMLAPYAFPGKVLGVNAWKKKGDNGNALVLMAVTGCASSGSEGIGTDGSDTVQSFFVMGKSTNSACVEAGLKANQFIAEAILGLKT